MVRIQGIITMAGLISGGALIVSLVVVCVVFFFFFQVFFFLNFILRWFYFICEFCEYDFSGWCGVVWGGVGWGVLVLR